MSNAQEVTTPEVKVTTQAGGAATATLAADFTRPEVEDKSLLAGKFKTPADLEKAYKELETKLGKQNPQQPTDEAEVKTEAAADGEEAAQAEQKADDEKKPKETEAEVSEDVYAAYGESIGKALKEAGIDPTEAQKEFAEKGELSEETRAEYDKLFGREVVDAYLRGVAANRETQAAITEAQITQIKSVVGGEDGFEKLRGWMSSNLTESDIAAYNDTLETGDVAKIASTLAEFNARYQADVGREGKLLGGKAAAATPGYASEEEMLRDMAKPEYKKDAAFRAEVTRKIAASPNLMVVR